MSAGAFEYPDNLPQPRIQVESRPSSGLANPPGFALGVRVLGAQDYLPLLNSYVNLA